MQDDKYHFLGLTNNAAGGGEELSFILFFFVFYIIYKPGKINSTSHR
jgi:hypothetical protein